MGPLRLGCEARAWAPALGANRAQTSTDPCCDPSAVVSFLGPYINSCREPGADVHRHDKPGKGTPRRLKHRAPSKALGANQAHKVSVRCVQFARDDCAPARNHAEMTPASFVSARRRLGRLRAERASQPMMGRGGGLGQWQGMSGASQKSLRASKKMTPACGASQPADEPGNGRREPARKQTVANSRSPRRVKALMQGPGEPHLGAGVRRIPAQGVHGAGLRQTRRRAPTRGLHGGGVRRRCVS